MGTGTGIEAETETRTEGGKQGQGHKMFVAFLEPEIQLALDKLLLTLAD